MKRLFLAVSAFAAVLAALFLGPRIGADPQGSRRAAPAAPSNWVTYEVPAGFRIQHPTGWSVQPRPGSIVALRSGDGTALALVRPVFGNGGGERAFRPIEPLQFRRRFVELQGRPRRPNRRRKRRQIFVHDRNGIRNTSMIRSGRKAPRLRLLAPV